MTDPITRFTRLVAEARARRVLDLKKKPSQGQQPRSGEHTKFSVRRI